MLRKLLTTLAVALCAVANMGIVCTPTVETFMLTFGASSVVTTNCFNTLPWGNTASAGACTTYTQATAFFMATGVPHIKKLGCMLLGNASTLAAGETMTITPMWTQFDGAGAVQTTDANVTIVFNDTTDDQIGDMVINSTASANSPYTGPQAMRLRMDAAGGDGATMPNAVCRITVEGPV